MNYKLLILMSFALFSCHSNSKNNSSDDTFKTESGKEITFHFIKHASLMISYDGKYIQVDPVGEMEPKTDYSKMPKADYIFITHDHFDHLDKAAIATLSKAGTQIIANASSQKQLGKGTVMKNGYDITLDCGINVKAVPAYNTTAGHTQYHPKGRDNGYVLTIENIRVYIAADTEDIPEMAELKNIDIAFLPCNQPFTMTPQQLAKAAKSFNPKVVYPYHTGETNVSTIPDMLKGSGIDVRIKKMP